MPRISAEQQREREEIIFSVVQKTGGLTEAELVVETGFERRTVNNYLNELEYQGRLTREGRVWSVSRTFIERKLRPVNLTAEQAMSLYVAARALARVQDERNETAETALIALSKALTGDFNIGREMHDAARDLGQRPERSGYNKVYRELMRACVYRKKAKIVYESAKGNSFETVFEPYLFEPSLFGFSIYAIGYSHIAQAYRSYKLERVRDAMMLSEPFEFRDNAPTLDSLRSAWSIMYGDETETVELEFSPQVRRRVLETNWHPSQRTDSLDATLNAPLRWEVKVADAIDMLAWVRGWGADVRVLQPEWLRNEVAEHARALTRTYGSHDTPALADVPAHRWLWAKADAAGNVHRLIYHMLDVGYCALALWRYGLNEQLKKRICQWLGLTEEDAGRQIAFWASLHDLGKASPAFQDHPTLRQRNKRLYERLVAELAQAGLRFPSRAEADAHARHEVISAWALRKKGENLLAADGALPESLAEMIAQMLGGHHGSFPVSQLFSGQYLQTKDKKNGDDDVSWGQARANIFAEMRDVFKPPRITQFEQNTARDNPALIALAGIVSAADWLGSDSATFPLTEEIMPIGAYARHSAKLAELALRKANWEMAPAAPKFNFERVFGFERRAAQEQASAALQNAPLPALVIAEMPMGSGKTEIAQEAIAQWMRRGGLNGAYIAMPTAATSNQMHARTSSFLEKFLGRDVEPLLVHGQALLRQLPERGDDDQIEEPLHDGDEVSAQAWFLPRKKSLLAPFGVGTVDQALMSVLQTKHFFVRLLGLSHKVIVFDEVHAYDTYMSVLFERLLAWLGQMGTSVVILSATLPEENRKKLIQAYAGPKSIPPAEYPRLVIVPLQGEVSSTELERPPAKHLTYEWMPNESADIVSRLREELKEGGCAAVICNTVSRAQEIYGAILNAGLIDTDKENEICILFHARFPMAWREGIENRVLEKFGPCKTDKKKRNDLRPRKAIVVATQVIEQSLDLDFDVMISDHAPVDLLLQRAGRLQRHAANDDGRKQPYRLLIAGPQVTDGMPQFSRADVFVYDEYVLLRSWLALHERLQPVIVVPNDMSSLIEQVYGNKEIAGLTDAILAQLEKARKKMERDTVSAEDKAEEHLVDKPNYPGLIFKSKNQELEEDENPKINRAFRAATRLGDPGINVVCLRRVDGELFAIGDHIPIKIAPGAAPSKPMIVSLLRSSINIKNPDPAFEIALQNSFKEGEAGVILKTWQKISALRYCGVAIFEGGELYLDSAGYVLKLDEQLGLKILKGQI